MAPDIPFARVALRQPSPDAVNLWIGNARSVTALHRDSYENVYVQLLGSKHFVLLPGLCQPCVNEVFLPPATFHRRPSQQSLDLRLDDDGGGDGRGEDAGAAATAGAVPFPIWDPDRPDVNATPYSHLARPMRLTLEPGDMLYLPAMWCVSPPAISKTEKPTSHRAQVPQGLPVLPPRGRQHLRRRKLLVSDTRHLRCSSPKNSHTHTHTHTRPNESNRYDMDFTGPLYPLTTFVRSLHQTAPQ